MLKRLFSMVLCSAALQLHALPATQPVQHYVFFNLDRAGIQKPWFANSKVFEGAQLKYTWRSLEPRPGEYDFAAIDQDLATLSAQGKRLFLQIQDVSFSEDIVNVPEYLRTDPAFHGGVDRQYEFANDQDAKPKAGGWVARRWDSAVAERFAKLLAALGARYDGRVEGITLPETSVDFGTTGKYWPQGYTPAGYPSVITGRMGAAKAAFGKSVVLQYANFFGGEWLPWDDKGYQRAVWDYAAAHGIVLGGPDLIPYKKAQMAHSYQFAQRYQGKVRTGYAVQEGNYAQTNAKTGKRMTVPDILDFAQKTLGSSYIFWYPEEPYFSRDVLPVLQGQGATAVSR